MLCGTIDILNLDRGEGSHSATGSHARLTHDNLAHDVYAGDEAAHDAYPQAYDPSGYEANPKPTHSHSGTQNTH